MSRTGGVRGGDERKGRIPVRQTRDDCVFGQRGKRGRAGRRRAVFAGTGACQFGRDLRRERTVDKQRRDGRQSDYGAKSAVIAGIRADRFEQTEQRAGLIFAAKSCTTLKKRRLP